MKKNTRTGLQTIVISIAILAVMLLLALLFLQPPQRSRDLVFGELGRAHSALTNLTESTSEPPVPAPSGQLPSPTQSAAVPPEGSSNNAAIATPAQSTNGAMASAVAAAMAAPPLTTGQPPSSLGANSEQAAPVAPSHESRLPVTAYVPQQAASPRTPPAPYIPPPSPEPGSKQSTPELLATVKDNPRAARGNQSLSTAALLGVDADIAAAVRAVAPTTTVAAASPRAGTVGETNVIFLIDHSLSMKRDGKSSRARGELLAMLESLGPAKSFFVLFFHSGGYEDMPGLGPVPATRENINAVTNWIFSAGHRFGSDPAEAMRRAVSMSPAPDTVWLISDGEFSPAVVEAIREANRSANARVNTVAIYNNDGREVMRQIAGENRGVSIFIPPPP